MMFLRDTQGKTGLLILGVLVIAVILIIVIAFSSINQLPAQDEEVTAAWSQVSNQYQRRTDLIPNLVNTVKGYAGHEKDVLIQVVEARAKVGQLSIPKDILTNPQAFSKFQAAQSQLSSALSRLLLVVEKYPDLKANQNFLTLQSQLEGTENRIAVARRDYIHAVKEYNTTLRTIPGRWVADYFYPEMEVKQNFSVAPATEQVPTVNFN